MAISCHAIFFLVRLFLAHFTFFPIKGRSVSIPGVPVFVGGEGSVEIPWGYLWFLTAPGFICGARLLCSPRKCLGCAKSDHFFNERLPRSRRPSPAIRFHGSRRDLSEQYWGYPPAWRTPPLWFSAESTTKMSQSTANGASEFRKREQPSGQSGNRTGRSWSACQSALPGVH